MRTPLIKLFSMLIFIMFSTFAFAGEGCDMHEGIHKDMSADALKEFKESHGWLFAEDAAAQDKKADQNKNSQAPTQQPVKSTHDSLVEI